MHIYDTDVTATSPVTSRLMIFLFISVYNMSKQNALGVYITLSVLIFAHTLASLWVKKVRVLQEKV